MHDRIFLPHWTSSSTTLSINKFVVQRKVICKEHLNIILFLSRFSIHNFLRARTFDQKYFPGWGEALFFVSQTANSNSPLMAWFWRGWGLGAYFDWCIYYFRLHAFAFGLCANTMLWG